MRTLIPKLAIFCLILVPRTAFSQCTVGFNQVTLNWDYLDYFPYNGNYTSANGYLASNTWTRTQNFAFGTQRVVITHNFSDAASLGENGSHTADANSFSTGDDIAFNGNGTITFTFDNEVRNLRFSVYDIDVNQILTVTGTSAGPVPLITMTEPNPSSAIVIAGSGTVSAIATADGTIRTNDSRATVNVTVAGPVRSVTLSFGGTAGDFWISDILACSAGNFATNYYNVARPFTGQAAYLLHAFDSAVYAVNVATGVTQMLFKDATGLGRINSMGYDPTRGLLYYVYSLTGSPGTNRRLMKYDFNTGTISTVLNDVSTIGIPSISSGGSTGGVESGAAAFYDGALYLGIETSNSGRTSGREAVIWRIDFNGSNVPFRASQVWAVPVDNGTGTLMHDWSDFAINDGILYDFDGAGVTTQTDVYHFNMLTGASTNYMLPSGWTPGQNAVAWNGTMYQMYATGVAPAVTPYIAVYNGSGGIGATTPITSTPMYTPAIPSLGDAAEAFRPLVDYGDAPTTYDPAGSDPAVHETVNTTLRLGANSDRELNTRGQTALANSDNFDDGIPSVQIFNPTFGNYLAEVNYFNNTGSTATICAWLDYDGDGLFDPSEGVSVTNLPSSASVQSVYLYWPSITSSLPLGTNTFLRVRIATTASGMTTANPTGYYDNGEVEDYRVVVNLFPLETRLLNFTAEKMADKVSLTWQTTSEEARTSYILERSADMQKWNTLLQKAALLNPGVNSYYHNDAKPLNGISYYRIRINTARTSYSEVRKIDRNTKGRLQLMPNPAQVVAQLHLQADVAAQARLVVFDMNGKQVYQQSLNLTEGKNTVPLSFVQQLANGIYQVRVSYGENLLTEKLIVQH
jgi:hypothetical protein